MEVEVFFWIKYFKDLNKLIYRKNQMSIINYKLIYQFIYFISIINGYFGLMSLSTTNLEAPLLIIFNLTKSRKKTTNNSK